MPVVKRERSGARATIQGLHGCRADVEDSGPGWREQVARALNDGQGRPSPLMAGRAKAPGTAPRRSQAPLVALAGVELLSAAGAASVLVLLSPLDESLAASLLPLLLSVELEERP